MSVQTAGTRNKVNESSKTEPVKLFDMKAKH